MVYRHSQGPLEPCLETPPFNNTETTLVSNSLDSVYFIHIFLYFLLVAKVIFTD